MKPTLCIILTVLTLTTTPLEVLVLTQNQGGIINLLNSSKDLNKKYLSYLEALKTKIALQNPDVIIYGIQELIELKPGTLIMKDLSHFMVNLAGFAQKDLDTKMECEFFKKALELNFPNYKVNYNPNLSMVTFVLVKEENGVVFESFEELKVVNKNGQFTDSEFNRGFWGQKGGLISLLEIKKNHVLFKIISINAHLDSKSAELRRNQYEELLEETKKVVDLNKIENYTIFFCGDMNSRLGEAEKKEINKENLNNSTTHAAKIYMDLREKNENFYSLEEFSSFIKEINGFKMDEMKITFQPTYKLKFKTDLDCTLLENYEECYKKKGNKKVLAYTDRIFYFSKSQMITGKKYGVINSPMISDHFTVFAEFSLLVINNELKKFTNNSIVFENFNQFENLKKPEQLEENAAKQHLKNFIYTKIMGKINNLSELLDENIVPQRDVVYEIDDDEYVDFKKPYFII